jgi:nitroreductase
MIRNTVLDCIRARRSTRSFLDRPVEDDLVETLLDAAIWAPSGSNNQSWLFTAVANRQTLLEINELVKQGFQTYVPDDDYRGKHLAKTVSQKEGYSFYYNAPVLIIASNKPNYENAMADCALGLENVFLAAQSLGLGSCYVNQLHWLRGDGPLREYLSGLGIPKEHTICSAAAIGYIARESVALARKPGTTQFVR